MAETVPEEFTKIIKDFVGDLKITFPEYLPLINKWWKDNSTFDNIEDAEERLKAINLEEKKAKIYLFDFCKKKFPPRFFDILYQNADMFKEDSETDTEFLPHIHFKNLWQFEITDNTRETIWKYLQLILFSIIGTLDNKEAFGDTAKLFEAINEDDFKSKLKETLTHMEKLFDMSGNLNEENAKNFGEGFNAENIPNANDIQEHITEMLGGKLGNLAKEIAEETANDFNLDMENVTDMKDIFQNLIKNPNKLMGLVKTVGDKLDSRIKSGEIKESELISEATEMMNKMKNMPGMGNIQSLLSKMGMGNLSGLGGKLNTGAMEAQLNKNMKMAKTKERIRAKAEANAKAKLEKQAADILQQQMQQKQPQQPTISEEELIKIFSTQEKIERTPRGANPNVQNKPDKKKKGKK
jgi:hypothetical protein